MPQGIGWGAAEGLRDVLTGLRQEQLDRQAEAERAAATAEGQRRFELGQARLAQQDRIAGTRQKLADDAVAAKQLAIQGFMTDPSKLQALAPVQRLLALNQAGVYNVGLDDLLSPEERTAQAQAVNEAKWNQRKQELDYLENQRRTRPQKISAANLRMVQDDPQLPRGVQSHLLQIRSRVPDFDTALAEFSNSLEAHQQAHPNLSPMKATAALRQLYAGSGSSRGTSPVRQIVNSVMGQQGGRSAGGSIPGSASADDKTVSTGDLEAIAKRRGTTVAQERARAQAAGYTVR